MKWNESGFRPPLYTYRLNWARRTSWGWWDDWDDTVLQAQDSKFGPWRSEAEHATSRSRRLPTILTFTRGWGRNIFVSFKPPRPGTEPRTLAWKAAVRTTTLGPPPAETGNWTPSSGVKGSGANHYPRAPAQNKRDNVSLKRSWEKASRHRAVFQLTYDGLVPGHRRRYWQTLNQRRIDVLCRLCSKNIVDIFSL